jgi:hypothetical protein
VQLALPVAALYRPAAQAAQRLFPADEYEPAAQLAQLFKPVAALNRPALQLVQLEARLAE